MRIPFPVLLSAPLLAVACVPRSEPAPPPQPMPPPAAPLPVPAPAGSDWRDWPLSPGNWVYRRDARGSLALYGPAGTDAALTLRCDRTARAIYLSISGTAATPLTIRTSSTTRAFPVRPTGGTPPYAAATFAANDPLLDAMAFSRGRFTVEQAGRAPLVLPAWAEIGRVVEDCRG